MRDTPANGSPAAPWYRAVGDEVDTFRSACRAGLPVLLKEENADRARFFEIVAKEQGTSPEVVGRKWADKAFEHAKGGEWLKTIDKDKKEQWVQKPKGN